MVAFLDAVPEWYDFSMIAETLQHLIKDAASWPDEDPRELYVSW